MGRLKHDLERDRRRGVRWMHPGLPAEGAGFPANQGGGHAETLDVEVQIRGLRSSQVSEKSSDDGSESHVPDGDFLPADLFEEEIERPLKFSFLSRRAGNSAAAA
jgi:hypothetical protein